MLTTLSLSCLTLLMSVQESLQEQTVEYKQLKETIRLLTRQSILQQFHIEQQTRAGGCSGIKQVLLFCIYFYLSFSYHEVINNA